MGKASFKITINTRGKGDLCPLSIRIGYNRAYKRIRTPIEILPNQFDKKAANKNEWRVIVKHLDKHKLNKLIKSYYDRFYAAVYALEATGQPYTVSSIKKRLLHDENKAVDVFTKILAEDRSIQEKTKKAITSTITRLTEFSPDTLIHEVTYEFTKEFESFLLTKPSRTNGTLSINTINKYIRDLSRMLDKAVLYEYINKNPISSYDNIVQRRQPIKTKHLTYDQLHLFENAILPDYISQVKRESLLYTLDAFLFACYTGLRIADLLTVCSEMIQKDILKLTTSKGKGSYIEIPMRILFNAKALSISAKYSRLSMPKKPFFRDRKKITHQGNIKTLNSIILPSQNVSFHTARHTFATLLREQGKNEVIVQRMLGHKSVSTTRNTYDHHSWEADREQLKKERL